MQTNQPLYVLHETPVFLVHWTGAYVDPVNIIVHSHAEFEALLKSRPAQSANATLMKALSDVLSTAFEKYDLKNSYSGVLHYEFTDGTLKSAYAHHTQVLNDLRRYGAISLKVERA